MHFVLFYCNAITSVLCEVNITYLLLTYLLLVHCDLLTFWDFERFG